MAVSEEVLLAGPLEPTNEPYAIAKIAGIKLCESYNRQYGREYRSVMPTNLYGPGDNYHPENSHVIPAMLRRFHEATQCGDPQVAVWGTGTPMREFLHGDDMAAASVFVMELDAATYAAHTQPMMSNVSRLRAMGWSPRIGLEEGLSLTVRSCSPERELCWCPCVMIGTDPTALAPALDKLFAGQW